MRCEEIPDDVVGELRSRRFKRSRVFQTRLLLGRDDRLPAVQNRWVLVTMQHQRRMQISYGTES